MSKKRTSSSLLQRFGKYVYFDSEGCWLWKAAKNEKGYGLIGVNIIDAEGDYKWKTLRAHRVAYEAFNFCNLKPDQCVCHICDNPPCVNPHHLFAGTRRDNVLDMIAKGRHKAPPVLRGKDSANAKLSDYQVKLIRQLYKNPFSLRKLANIFGVSHTLILRIVNHKSWRHV
ncbi:MAG: hypothetical protein DGJ47_000343 [Rickettsiaceae bacterium]